MRSLVWVLILSIFGARAIAPGDLAPLPKVTDSYGKPVDLAEVAKSGKYIVLWFYPKASSPGCSAQGKRYAELYEEFARYNVEIFGVSHDPAAEQCEFIEKLALKGAMIPDREGTLARAYKVNSFFGFYARDTFLINPQGTIEKVWRSVNPFKDADTVLAYLKQKLGK